MYPYFQKNQKPNPSNSSKLSVREASPADPLRQFLAAPWLLEQRTAEKDAVSEDEEEAEAALL